MKASIMYLGFSYNWNLELDRRRTVTSGGTDDPLVDSTGSYFGFCSMNEWRAMDASRAVNKERYL